MTRFDADTPTERRKLFADAVTAHRTRASQFLTVEADSRDGEEVAPWVQVAENTLNLDCDDDELTRLKSTLSDYPAFRIDRLESPDDVDGTNVRISARADPKRLAQFIDQVFQDVYEREESYRAWVTDV